MLAIINISLLFNNHIKALKHLFLSFESLLGRLCEVNAQLFKGKTVKVSEFSWDGGDPRVESNSCLSAFLPGKFS